MSNDLNKEEIIFPRIDDSSCCTISRHAPISFNEISRSYIDYQYLETKFSDNPNYEFGFGGFFSDCVVYSNRNLLIDYLLSKQNE